MTEPREQSLIDPGRWVRELPALLTLVCGFAASLAVFGFGRAYEVRQIAAEFRLASEEHVSSIQAELSHDLNSLAMVATLLATYPQMDRARFRRLVAPLRASRSSVQALEWAPRIRDRDRAGYEERVRNELPGYRITEQSSSGEVVRAAKREEYFPVHFVEPLSGNEPAVGFDLASEAVRREALARARDLGNGAATARITLVQERSHQFGFLVVVPRYRGGTTPPTVEGRREQLEGFVLGVFRVAAVVEHALVNRRPRGIDLHVYDRAAPPTEQFLYTYISRAREGPPGAAPREAVAASDLYHEARIDLPGREWWIVARPTPEFLAARTGRLPLAMLFAGFVFTITLFAYLVVNGRRTERLEESEERFRLLARTSPSVVWRVDSNGSVTYINERMEAITGIPASAVKGTAYLDWIHPEDRESVDERWRETIEAGRNWREEVRLLLPDGRILWLLSLAAPFHSPEGRLAGYIGTGTDITDLKRVETELRESEERFVRLAEASPSIVFRTDTEGRATYVNDRWQELTGLPAGSWQGHGWASAIVPEDQSEAFESWGRAVAAGGPWEHEIRFPRASGGEVWVLSRAVPTHDAEGRIDGYVGTSTDITEMKEAERQLIQAKEDAEAATRAKSEFLANMSHEIRTPMTSILGFSHLLTADSQFSRMPQDWRTGLETIERSGRHLLRLIEDILDLSKIEAGRLSFEVSPCSPFTVLEEVTGLLRARAESKGLSLECHPSDNVPRIIHTDAVRLHQILTNLVSNAIKFTDRGTVSIDIYRCEDGLLAFEVKDTGIGMNEVDRRRVVEPFVQVDTSTARRHGGTGLGLSISRRLCELLGGEITIESRLGEGTKVTARIAIAPHPGPEPRREPIDRAAPIPGKELEDRRILVVEDSEDSRLLITLMLEREGACVVTAEDGRSGVDRALAAAREDEPFDAVLMDIRLPGTDGSAATRELRSSGFASPIIAITAHAMRGDRARCLAAGYDEYLTKPIDGPELIDALARLLSTSSG